MSLLDILTGGKDKEAQNSLKRAEQAFTGIQAPSAQQLTLPELKQMVQAGILTPAQAQTYLQQGNAYNDINLDPTSTMAQTDVLNKLKGVSDAGGMTPQMRAQLTAALDQVSTANRGSQEAITDQFAQRGVPSSLMAEAAMRESAGNEARNANLTATQAAGQAEQNAINAMMNEGNLASTMHGQQYSEAANKAAAENAMRQWNAGAQNTAAESNAQRQQEANAYNQQNKQNIENANTGLVNERSVYNANIPQQVFQNQITKASGQAGVNQAQANQATQSGNQMIGLIGGLTGAAATTFAPGAKTAQTAFKPSNPTEDMFNNQYKTGGYAEGGLVPGDSPKNDVVPAMLSPGEVVVPRSIAPNPDAVKRFVQSLTHGQKPQSSVHPDDVHTVLEALTSRRQKSINQDGKQYDFRPGEHGSLTAPSNPQRFQDVNFNPEHRAKIVQVGSSRG